MDSSRRPVCSSLDELGGRETSRKTNSRWSCQDTRFHREHEFVTLFTRAATGAYPYPVESVHDFIYIITSHNSTTFLEDICLGLRSGILLLHMVIKVFISITSMPVRAILYCTLICLIEIIFAALSG
jgi:hypothetical protein